MPPHRPCCRGLSPPAAAAPPRPPRESLRPTTAREGQGAARGMWRRWPGAGGAPIAHGIWQAEHPEGKALHSKQLPSGSARWPAGVAAAIPSHPPAMMTMGWIFWFTSSSASRSSSPASTTTDVVPSPTCRAPSKAGRKQPQHAACRPATNRAVPVAISPAAPSRPAHGCGACTGPHHPPPASRQSGVPITGRGIPTSSSWVLEMSTSTFAAGLST